MDDLHGGDAQMHMTEAEQPLHVHYMHDQNHGMHHLSNDNGLEDDHDRIVAGTAEGIDGELHNHPGNGSDNHGGMMGAITDNNQLTLSFQGQVYVFDSVSPEKVCLVSFTTLIVNYCSAICSISCFMDVKLMLMSHN